MPDGIASSATSASVSSGFSGGTTPPLSRQSKHVAYSGQCAFLRHDWHMILPEEVVLHSQHESYLDLCRLSPHVWQRTKSFCEHSQHVPKFGKCLFFLHSSQSTFRVLLQVKHELYCGACFSLLQYLQSGQEARSFCEQS